MLDLKDEWLGLSNVAPSKEVYDSIYDDICGFLSSENINEMSDEDIHKLCVLFCTFPVDFQQESMRLLIQIFALRRVFKTRFITGNGISDMDGS